MKIIFHRRYIKWIIGLAIILPLLFAMQTVTDQAKAVEKHKESETIIAEAKNFEGKAPGKKLTHEQIVSLTEGFMDTLVQEIDNQNRIVNFETKRELLEAFGTVATKEVASGYVDFYFIERQDGLYIKPTETPPWFNPENEYEKIKDGQDRFKVVQSNLTDLYGSYSITIEFTHLQNQWKITNVAY